MNRLRLRFVLILLAFAAMPAFANDTVYYYHTDAQGTAVVVTDANHNVVERTYYGPYGEVLNRALRDGPGYTGHEEDAATGLDNMQQRYYDPITGRFPSVDPMPVDTTTAANFNRYAYANDNPYRFTDPDGRMANQDMEQSPCTGSHIGGGACGSLNLSRIQVGMPSKSEEQQMRAQQQQSFQSASARAGTTQNSTQQSQTHQDAVSTGFSDGGLLVGKPSVSVTGMAAFGGGVQVTKGLYNSDSTAGIVTPALGLTASVDVNLINFKYRGIAASSPIEMKVGANVSAHALLGGNVSLSYSPPATFQFSFDAGAGAGGGFHFYEINYVVDQNEHN